MEKCNEIMISRDAANAVRRISSTMNKMEDRIFTFLEDITEPENHNGGKVTTENTLSNQLINQVTLHHHDGHFQTATFLQQQTRPPSMGGQQWTRQMQQYYWSLLQNPNVPTSQKYLIQQQLLMMSRPSVSQQQCPKQRSTQRSK